MVHRQGCGRVELGSFWRLKASLDTKKQTSSVLEDLLFDAISVCVRVLFTPNFVILQLFLQIDTWTTNLVQKFGHGADQKIRVYSWISRKEWTSHDSKKGCKQKKVIFSSISNFNIQHAYCIILKLGLFHARWKNLHGSYILQSFTLTVLRASTRTWDIHWNCDGFISG